MRRSKVRKSKVRRSKRKFGNSKKRSNKLGKGLLLIGGVLGLSALLYNYTKKSPKTPLSKPQKIPVKNFEDKFKERLEVFFYDNIKKSKNKETTHRNHVKDENSYINRFNENLNLNPYGKNIYTQYFETELMQDKVKINIINTEYNNNNNYDLIEQLSGPVGYCHVIFNGIEILLFADVHVRDNLACKKDSINTVNISKLVQLLIKSNPNVSIDFFMEDFFDDSYIKYSPDTDYEESQYTESKFLGIDILRGYLRSCCPRQNKSEKLDCSKNLKNLRLHHIDYVKPAHDVNIIRGKIDKQIDNINDKEIVNKIKKFAEYISSEEGEYMTEYKKMNYNFRNKNRIIVDIYTLSRLLRNFDDYNTKYSIIYAGFWHIITYIKFFEMNGAVVTKYGDIKKMEIREDIKQCVNVNGSGLPFFKNNTKLSDKYKTNIINYIKQNDLEQIDKLYRNYK